MTTAPHRSLVQVTLVTAPGCHFCEDAHKVLTDLQEQGQPIGLELVSATSPEGVALLATHRPAMNPLVLVDGAYFSAGRLPRRKLQALLDRSATTVKAPIHG